MVCQSKRVDSIYTARRLTCADIARAVCTVLDSVVHTTPLSGVAGGTRSVSESFVVGDSRRVRIVHTKSIGARFARCANAKQVDQVRTGAQANFLRAFDVDAATSVCKFVQSAHLVPNWGAGGTCKFARVDGECRVHSTMEWMCVVVISVHYKCINMALRLPEIFVKSELSTKLCTYYSKYQL